MLLNGIIYKDFNLRHLNRVRTGGKVDWFAQVTNTRDLLEVLRYCQDSNLPFYVIGAGSNVLINDNDLHGLVIKLAGDFTRHIFMKIV